MKKAAYGSLGFIFLALGITGIFLPVLPTTPFMLLASFFFLRSSERMHRWITNHKVFGPPIKNYMKYRGMRKSTKVKAVSTLWLSLGLSIYIVKNMYVDALLIFIGIAVSLYLLSLKTITEEYLRSQE
ncbi:MAG: YbaN family protein [Deferribacterales bacterium]